VSEPLVVPLVDEGLGNSTYLVDLGSGRALVVDPSRDLRAIRAAAAKRGLRVAYAAETHLHADFLSGATQLAATDGATVLASAAGGRRFPHTGLGEGDEVDLGGLRLRALTTPGHTDDHVAFLLLDGDRLLGVFTGGSLIVGSAARTDLVDPGRIEELACAQYRSLHRLVQLPDDVAVWPTHGAGSFCSAPPGAERTSSIGTEKATNPLLRAPDEDAFVAQLVGSLGSFPPYFLRLGEVNRRGPDRLDRAPALPPLTPGETHRLVTAGGAIVDVRPVEAFAAAHVTGSLSIPLRGAFATWLGWVAASDRLLVIVRDADQDPDEVAWQAAKVGYDNLAGELAGGLDAARGAGMTIGCIPLVTPTDLGDTRVLDIRQDAEFADGHVPGADHVELGDLPARASDVPAGPTVVTCGHGERAMTGASLLARAGRRDVAVLAGGPDDWAAAHQQPLATGA
jgi:glyoxylase-like metal-dependent hydrolase (beta-lactamase superfamily II)/rhodanese-related sulfurtransferase